MRRYTITVNDVTRVIDVEELTADTYRVRLDGRFVDVRLDDHRGLAHAAIAPTVEAARTARPEAPESLGAGPLPGPAPDASVLAATASAATASAGGVPEAPATRPAPAASGGGRTDRMTAPMPGTILSVLTAAGASVTRGQPVMVLEAMKMKNELKAPRDGTVAELYVADGAQVKYGEPLLRFEEHP